MMLMARQRPSNNTHYDRKAVENVKYLSQLCIIMGFSLIGEALQRLLPFPIPGTVYSIVLLFLALCLKIIKPEQVKETARFLTSVLPVLFVAPAVGIVEYWELLSGNLLPVLLLLLATTALTFGISGGVVQWLTKKEDKTDE
jgi:holin-like protein